MDKKIIAVDLDDVLVDFNGSFLRWHNQKFGSNVNYGDIVDSDMTGIYDVDFVTLVNRFYQFCTDDWQSLTVMSGSEEALASLSRIGILHNVTARCESLRPVTEHMLGTYFPGVFKKLHFTNGVTIKYPERKRSKVEVCREINARVLIDDNKRLVDEFANTDISFLVPDRPWNQGVLPRNAVRCGLWHDPSTCWKDIIAWVESNY